MSETITRIQFSDRRVTIYSDAGIFAIWTGKKARILRDLCRESIDQILARERAAKEDPAS